MLNYCIFLGYIPFFFYISNMTKLKIENQRNMCKLVYENSPSLSHLLYYTK